MTNPLDKTTRLVTVFGGSGFVGRHVVRALTERGWRVRVACRRPDLANHLQPLGRVGQIHAVQANLRFPASVAAALTGAEAAINLVGIMHQSGRQRFDAVQAFGAGVVANAVQKAGITRFVHMSALGADIESESAYARTKAQGEAHVREMVPQASILRPSVMFGPEDDLFNRFAAMARMMPVLPLIGGGETKFQPLYVGDVAQAVARLLDGEAAAGRTWELGGPEVKTLRELMQTTCEITGRKRLFVPVPFALANLKAFGIEVVNSLTLGLYPKTLLLTRDQVKLLKVDNVVSEAAKSAGTTLEGLGIAPDTIEAVVPSYLYRFRRTGQFESKVTA